VEQCFEEGKGEVGLDEYARAFLAGMVPSRDSLNARIGFLTVLQANEKDDVLKKSLNSLPRPQSQRRSTLFKLKYLLISL
jgi:hypothetical protein